MNDYSQQKIVEIQRQRAEAFKKEQELRKKAFEERLRTERWGQLQDQKNI